MCRRKEYIRGCRRSLLFIAKSMLMGVKSASYSEMLQNEKNIKRKLCFKEARTRLSMVEFGRLDVLRGGRDPKDKAAQAWGIQHG